MATYAFLNLPARGHINPTLPIVKELVARGDDVYYFTAEEFKELIESVGAKFQLLPPLERIGSQDENTSGMIPGDKQIELLPFAMAYQSSRTVPHLVETIKTIQAGCLVYNAMSLWARLAAYLLDLPAVEFRPYHAPRKQRSVPGRFTSERLAALAAAGDRELEKVASSYGRCPKTLHELVSTPADLTVVFMPREFQFEAESFDDRFLFVGPSLFEASPHPWPFSKDKAEGPLRAYISLGRFEINDAEFYRTCFSAFDQREWQVVMSVGERIDRRSLGSSPKNFYVASSVPQTAILPHVDVFVTHGGLNSVMESLYFGVPVVVVPSIKEQRLTASRVRELGLGAVLERETLTPQTLQQHARSVGCDEETRDRIKTMQSFTHSAGGCKRATEAIVRFAANA